MIKPFERMLPENQPYYVHVMSRVVDRRFVMGLVEKDYFVKLMRKLSAFAGIEIVTYCVMDNHFHLLCHVPEVGEMSDAELLKRLGHIYDRVQLGEVKQRLERFKAYTSDRAYQAERRKHLQRMGDLGEFMKALKQQFTRWYNRKHCRKGTLWEARYKSVVVEGAGNPLLTMATYIDLNPVRAGLCRDPKDYRWSGYGESVSGSKVARSGLKRIAIEMERSTDWRMVQRTYRMWIYGKDVVHPGVAEPTQSKQAFDQKRIARVWEEGGELTRTELLHCRVRYFSDGLAIGSQSFLEEFYESFRARFGKKRKQAGKKLRGKGFGDLYAVRDLQVDVVGSG